MLEDIVIVVIDEVIYRLANPARVRAALVDLGVEDWEEVNETIEFLQTTGADDVSVLLAAPFAEDPTRAYKPLPTRFSDGTWRVFYGALEPETCEAERGYWCRRNLQSEPPELRRFHFREFRSRVKGSGYDLRPMKDGWPFLTGDTASYPQCQDLAGEARAASADAMLCPSARREGGTTVPVFVQRVLSEATIIGLVSIQIDTEGSVSVTHH